MVDDSETVFNVETVMDKKKSFFFYFRFGYSFINLLCVRFWIFILLFFLLYKKYASIVPEGTIGACSVPEAAQYCTGKQFANTGSTPKSLHSMLCTYTQCTLSCGSIYNYMVEYLLWYMLCIRFIVIGFPSFLFVLLDKYNISNLCINRMDRRQRQQTTNEYI